MARPPLKRLGSVHQPVEHTAAGTLEAMLDGYGFGLLPSAAALMFPTAFPEDQNPRPGVSADRARRRSGRYLDRVIGYAIRRGRAWLNRGARTGRR